MASRPTLHDFLNILPAVVYEYVIHKDGSSELLYLSPSSQDVLGHPPEYLTQDLNRFWLMVHPDDLARLRRADMKANRNSELFVSEVRVTLPTGEERWVQLSSKPTLHRRRGAPIWIGYIIDITRIKRMEDELREANRKLKALATTDGLTGLANRRHFDERLISEWARFKRMEKPLSLILIDIDLFKSYNDHYGHQMGDHCLQNVANTLKKSARRAGDLPARYGGEEFVVIAVDTDLSDAQVMAEGIRRAVESMDMKHEGAPFGKVTVSIGVSSIYHNEYPDQEHLLKAADLALYRAKNDCRNCVRLADEGLQCLNK